jgi:hypothetical protein
MIAAVTPIIDRYYSIFNVLGERFLQVRWHRPTSPKAGQVAIGQQGREIRIREQLRTVVKGIFDKSSNTPPKMRSRDQLRIANLAELVAIARTHVIRSNFGNREIEYVPEPEANTRISKGLASIARGIAALNCRQAVAEQDLQDAFRVGTDSMSENRRRILVKIARDTDPFSADLPRTLADREIQELQALRLVTERPYRLTENAAQLLDTADLVIDGVPWTNQL